MKYKQNKAFPYPVLRTTSDDYTEGSFQAAIFPEVNGDGDGLRLSIRGNFIISVEEIQKLIDRELAQYSIIVDCRSTFIRRHIATLKNSFDITFKPGELDGEFTVSSSIVAIKDIYDYKSKLLHQDFGPDGLDFKKGELLAQAEDTTHYITRDYFKPLTSVFEFDVDSKIKKNMFAIDLTGDKVAITLTPDLLDDINKIKATGKYRPIIFNSFYLPCLIRVLAAMDDDEQKQEFAGKKWFNVINQKLIDLKISRPIKDPAYVAQELFQSPIKLLITMFDKLEGTQ